jgi:hypothetical protein
MVLKAVGIKAQGTVGKFMANTAWWLMQRKTKQQDNAAQKAA